MASDKTILLIDDDYDMHIMCRRYITNGGYNFLSAYNGRDGLKLIKQTSIDLVLLDYMMPEMNGYEVYKAISTEHEFKRVKSIPVIMLTVLSDNSSQKNSLLNMGLTLFLQKPFGFKELLDVIESVFISHQVKIKQEEQIRLKLIQSEALQEENRKLQVQLKNSYQFDNIITITKSMRDIFDKISKISKSDSNVFI